MINLKLIIAYDGNDYLGWQKTKEGPSIEESLQTVIEQIVQHPVTLQAASRTDAGVHAYAQVVNFLTAKTELHLHRFLVSLNNLLPSSISVFSVEQMPLDFHPTLDCVAKEYHYWICCGVAQYPQHRFYSWHYPYALNIGDMREAASLLIGQQDYQAFCNELKNKEYDSYVREVTSIEVVSHSENRIQIMIRGNNFLYKMVRNLVGTLAYVGRGKISVNDIPTILASQDRTKAGLTAPAHGLTLYDVFYPPA
jgi:tRNA pseudouridine38-40 synthase